MATVRKIFELAAAILFEEKGTDDDFDKYAPRFLERLLVCLLYTSRKRGPLVRGNADG